VYPYVTYKISTTTFGHLLVHVLWLVMCSLWIPQIYEVKELTPVYNIVTSYSATSNVASYLSLGG